MIGWLSAKPNVSDLAERPKLSVSIVLYRPDMAKLRDTLNSLVQAIEHSRSKVLLGQIRLDIIHNDDSSAASIEHEFFSDLFGSQNSAVLHNLVGHGNIGYGRAHNLAIAQADTDYHLILNPDVILGKDSLSEGLAFLAQHNEVALVAPQVKGEDGAKQFGCKRFPSVFDFLLRGFAPKGIKQYFQKRLAYYEMHDLSEDAVTTDVPIVSGCFMLFRTEALRQIDGFDERYFLYFEDFDISIRVRPYGQIAYLPQMHIVHLGGNSAKKGLRHILMFARSGLRFFHSHGWRLL